MNQQIIITALQRHATRIMLLILLAHGIVQISQINRDDITADEEDHLIYGVAILKGEPSRRVAGRDFRSTMPITAIHALPRAFEQLIQPGTRKSDWGKEDIRHGRYMTLLFTLGLLAYIFFFSRSLFGPLAALTSLALAAADPNILAHGHLLTTDMASCFCCVATLYHLQGWLVQKQKVQFLLFSLFMALAQVSKLNNLVLYPISLMIITFFQWPQRSMYKQGITYLTVFLFLQWLVINLAFQFQHTGFLFNETIFSSEVMLSSVGKLPFLSPLPLPYVDTFDQIYYEIQTRQGLPLNYLLGQTSRTGFWNYFLVCMGIKTPLASLLIFMGSILLIIFHWKYVRTPFIFLILPAAAIFIFISTAKVQNGYRYALPVLALLIIASGKLTKTFEKSFYGKTIVIMLLGLTILETGTSRNGFIPFTNVIVGDKKYAWEWLADSNLNWGQNHERLKGYLGKHPEAVLNPERPSKGLVIVDINELTGIWQPGKYDWLTSTHKPTDQLWESYIVFDTR